VEHSWTGSGQCVGARLEPDPRISDFLKLTRGRTIELARLSYVASEIGARSVREQADIEPLQWLMEPRRVFEGRTALQACRSEEGFRRAVVLHGMNLGLDVEPAQIAGIPATAFLSQAVAAQLSGAPPIDCSEPERWKDVPFELYTCSISADFGPGQVQIFCAMVAHDSREVRNRLRRRYGPLLEDEAHIRLGFDWSEPIACALVSEAMGHLLLLIAQDPNSQLAKGLDFQVEQRFAQ
jgi:hypothetical protein